MTKPPFRYSIIILCIFTACVFFIRCFFHVLSGDELIYTFIWEPDDPTWLWDIGHRFEHKAIDLSDILQTQLRHYHEVNGRFFVHTTEQLFTNHMMAFSIVNTIVFILFIWFIVWYANGKPVCNNYLMWLCVTLAILYLFPYPESLWTSVNYGLNYLWPATLSVGGLLIWDKLNSGFHSKYTIIPIVIFGILLGWSNEAFSVGFAGGMFIFYCLHFRYFRGSVLWFIIPLWLATACMVFAPGNIKRFLLGTNEGESVSYFYKLLNGLDNFIQLKIIWVLVFGIILLWCIKRLKNVKVFIHQNQVIICIFSVTLLFCSIFHTAPYSSSFLELISLLLILKYVVHNPVKLNIKLKRGIALTFTLLFIVHQITLSADTITLYGQQSRMITNYSLSSDGLVKLENTGISQLSKPFLRGADASYWCNAANVIHGVYGKWQKPPILLLPEDYEAIASPNTFFNEGHKCLGNAPVYHKSGGLYYWLDTLNFSAGTPMYVKYKPYKWSFDGPFYLKLKFALFPDTIERMEIVKIDTVHTRFGTSYRLNLTYTPQIRAFYIPSPKQSGSTNL